MQTGTKPFSFLDRTIPGQLFTISLPPLVPSCVLLWLNGKMIFSSPLKWICLVAFSLPCVLFLLAAIAHRLQKKKKSRGRIVPFPRQTFPPSARPVPVSEAADF